MPANSSQGMAAGNREVVLRCVVSIAKSLCRPPVGVRGLALVAPDTGRDDRSESGGTRCGVERGESGLTASRNV